MKNFDVAKTRFLAAMDFLKQQSMVDQTKIAAIGYCFGGGVVLNMARQGADLKGVASFHGSLAAVSPAKIGIVKANILVLHGADDMFVKPEQIESFKKRCQKQKLIFNLSPIPEQCTALQVLRQMVSARNSTCPLPIMRMPTNNPGRVENVPEKDI